MCWSGLVCILYPPNVRMHGWIMMRSLLAVIKHHPSDWAWLQSFHGHHSKCNLFLVHSTVLCDNTLLYIMRLHTTWRRIQSAGATAFPINYRPHCYVSLPRLYNCSMHSRYYSMSVLSNSWSVKKRGQHWLTYMQSSRCSKNKVKVLMTLALTQQYACFLCECGKTKKPVNLM